MNNTVVPPKLHPALLVAAVSVTIFSLVGIGVLTGVIPGNRAEPPTAAQTTAPAPAVVVPAPAATVPAPQAATPAPAAAPAPAPKPAAKVVRAPVKKEVAPPAAEAGLPPPPPAPMPMAGAVPPAQPADFCRDCGTIEAVREVVATGEGTGLGAVAGGVAGGVLGNQVGGGRGRDVATVLGILGGAVAGHQVEKAVRKTTHYEITVHMDDGGVRTIASQTPPAWRTGDRVQVVNGALIAK